MTRNWMVLTEEVIGSTEDMVWLKNQNGEKALFKPDLTGNDYIIEKNVYSIATFLGIDCSRVERYTLNGIDGFLSCVEGHNRWHRVNGFDLYRNSSKYSSKAISISGTEFSDDIEFSLIWFRDNTKFGCFEDLCKVMLLDAICKNQDRHIGNLDFVIDIHSNLIDVAPIYDNVMSLSNARTESSMFPIDANRVWKHTDIFTYLLRNDLIQEQFDLLQSDNFRLVCDKLEFGTEIYNRVRKLFAAANSPQYSAKLNKMTF